MNWQAEFECWWQKTGEPLSKAVEIDGAYTREYAKLAWDGALIVALKKLMDERGEE